MLSKKPYDLDENFRERIREIGVEVPDRPLDINDLRQLLKEVRAEKKRLYTQLADLRKRKGKAQTAQVEYHCELCATPVLVSRETPGNPIVFCGQQCCDRYVQVESLTPERAIVSYDADGKIYLRT